MSNETNTIDRTKIEDIASIGEELSMEELEQVAGGQAEVVRNGTCTNRGYD